MKTVIFVMAFIHISFSSIELKFDNILKNLNNKTLNYSSDNSELIYENASYQVFKEGAFNVISLRYDGELYGIIFEGNLKDIRGLVSKQDFKSKGETSYFKYKDMVGISNRKSNTPRIIFTKDVSYSNEEIIDYSNAHFIGLQEFTSKGALSEVLLNNSKSKIAKSNLPVIEPLSHKGTGLLLLLSGALFLAQEIHARNPPKNPDNFNEFSKTNSTIGILGSGALLGAGITLVNF